MSEVWTFAFINADRNGGWSFDSIIDLVLFFHASDQCNDVDHFNPSEILTTNQLVDVCMNGLDQIEVGPTLVNIS